MSTPIQIRDLADLAAEYLRHDRGFARLKAIVQIMQPWRLIQMEQDDETDAFHLTFFLNGHRINFLSDGTTDFRVLTLGDENWITAMPGSGGVVPLENMISILRGIKSKLSYP